MNIRGFNLSLSFFSTYKGVLSKRLDLLKEISELAPEYMPIIDMSSDTVEESCKFLKAALGCGLDKKLIELGLEFKLQQSNSSNLTVYLYCSKSGNSIANVIEELSL